MMSEEKESSLETGEEKTKANWNWSRNCRRYAAHRDICFRRQQNVVVRYNAHTLQIAYYLTVPNSPMLPFVNA